MFFYSFLLIEIRLHFVYLNNESLFIKCKLLIFKGLFNDRLVNENGLITLTYTGQPVSTRLEFYCDYNEERVDYLYFLESKNQNVLGIYSYLACPPYLSRQNIDFKCFISFADPSNPFSPPFVHSFFNTDFKFRFKHYKLAFKVCGLLSSKLEPIQEKSNCYDKFGFALGSACLWDDKSHQDFNLGISKGPFISSFAETSHSNEGEEISTTAYTLSYTQGDVCQLDKSKQMQLNVIFKCTKSARGGGFTMSNNKMELLDVGDKCSVNIQLEIKSFCEKVEEISEQTQVKKFEKEFAYDEASDLYCTFNQTFDQNQVHSYNLSQLANRTFRISSTDLEVKFRVCHNIHIEQCNMDNLTAKFNNGIFYGGGACALNAGHSCLFAKANDHFKVLQDGYRIRLVYSALDPVLDAYKCRNVEDNLVIDFICDPGVDGNESALFLSRDDKNMYAEMRTRHACPVKLSRNYRPGKVFTGNAYMWLRIKTFSTNYKKINYSTIIL